MIAINAFNGIQTEDSSNGRLQHAFNNENRVQYFKAHSHRAKAEAKARLFFDVCGLFFDLFTARKRSLGEGNIFRSVCQEFCPQWGGGEVCLSACWDTLPGPGTSPGPGTPPGAGTPRDQAPRRAEHAGRYGQRAGGTHPTGMQSCLLVVYIFRFRSHFCLVCTGPYVFF